MSVIDVKTATVQDNGAQANVCDLIRKEVHVNRASTCVDGGSSNGWMALSMAEVCGSIIIHEPDRARREGIETARRKWHLGNVTLEASDISCVQQAHEAGTGADLITLAMPKPESMLDIVSRTLKIGSGHVAAFVPAEEGAVACLKELAELCFVDRHWKETTALDLFGESHDGIMVFARMPSERERILESMVMSELREEIENWGTKKADRDDE